MHLNVPWSWIVGVVAAAIVIASVMSSRRKRAETIPTAELDESGSFPILAPPESAEAAEILVPPEAPVAAEQAVEEPLVERVTPPTSATPKRDVADAAPAVADTDVPSEDELDDALDRVVR